LRSKSQHIVTCPRGVSRAFHWCGLISIAVIGHRHESIRDKTSWLAPDVQVQQTPSTFHPLAQRNASVITMRVNNPDRPSTEINS